uniref:Filamentous hemagglutinin family N-terminal domain-containing protein n=1 Tax=Candidatus Kentrum sp. DK TaxID=2126562 RepID=A0A450SGB9_9GAMM|nr:MAG: filamentous hemagglutinin family N-terminal domain-containing protein [Candidatus Kentron sp. DK]
MHRNRLNPKALYSVTATDDQYKVTTKTRKSKRIFRQFTLSGMICAVLGQVPVSYAGDITPDGTTQTAIDQAQNGVRTVNIAPPTQGGVSHNKYTGFNVEKTGAIMNNSLEIGVSQLGGALPANPHFTDRTAEVILNEVTSTQRSELKGYTEIFGDRAEYILANPNGITCSGCGFINTSRLGLVTGTPRLDVEGKLDDIAIGQGDVLIEGEGMNAENVRYVDIVTRVAKIQGELIAGDEINIHTGNDRFDYKTRTVSSDPNKTPTEGTTFSVDASALGSMYAGKIQIVSTEAGFGVRDDATLMANVDDLVITAEGDITYTNALAERDIALQARDSITQTGISQAGNDLRVTAGEGITFSGSSVAGKGMARSGGNMIITAGGAVDNTPHRLIVDGNLKLAATALDNRDGGQIEGRNAGTELALNVGDTLQNDGGSIISAGNVSLVLGADHDLRGTLSAGETLSVTAHGLRNLTRLDAGEMLRLTAAGGFFNESSAVLASSQDMEVTAAQAVTNAGEITSGRNLRLEARGGDITNETGAKVTGGEGTTTLVASSSVINRNKLSSARDLAITAAGLDNYGQIATGRDLTTTVTGDLYNRDNTLLFAGRELTLNVGGALDNNRGNIYAQEEMTLQGINGGSSASIRNYVGTIEAGGNMTIRTDTLDNLAEEYDPDSGGYYGYNVVRVSKGGYGRNVHSVMEQDETTSTLRADPAYISAGGNLGIYNATINNYSSVISAHGNLTVSGGSLNNETASEDTVDLNRKWGKTWQTSHQDCWFNSWGVKIGCKTVTDTHYDTYWDTYTSTVYAQEEATFSAHGTVDVDASRVDNGPLDTTIAALNNPSSTTAYNTAAVEQVRGTGQFDLTGLLDLPQGEHGLFVLNKPDAGRRYLVETNVEFIDTSQFVGSEYFLDRMGVDLDENLRLMGDAVVETRLVRHAIGQVMRHPFLSEDVISSSEQMKRLYDDAFAEAERFEQEGMPLTVGVALSPEQVKSLRHDILWLEEREIAGARVLAPQLYLSQTTLAQIETGTGPVISGGDVLLATEQDLGNRGLITARQDIGISSEGSFTNVGSVDAGESLVADIKEDIVNRGPGSLYGGDLVALYAGGDIRNESTVEEVHLGEDIVSRMKDIASIGSGGDLILDAGGDIVQKAAKLGASGSALLNAEGDIRFEPIALRNKSVINSSSSSRGLFGSSSSSYSATHDRTEHIGSEAVFGGDLIMSSGGDTTLTASRLEVGGGADVTTGGSFNLLSAQNTYHSETHYEYDGGLFGSSGAKDTVSDRTQQVSSVLKTGGDLSVDSKNSITLLASTIESGGMAALKAGANINVLNAYDTEYQRTQTSKSGLVSAKQVDKGRIDDTVVASVIKSGGDLSFEAGGGVALIGSELDVEEDLSFGTFTVARDAEENLMTDEYGHYVTQDGATVGSLTVASAEERHESWNIVKKQSYLKAMVVGGLVGGLGGMLLAREGAKQGMFAEVEEHEYRERSTQQVSSLLDVEGDLRANTEGDITIIASNVQVEGSGAIHAGGDVNILSAQETKSRSESHEKLDIGGVTGGWDGSRLSAGVKGEYTKDTLTETAVTQKKSQLGFGGGLLLNTEGSALISASDIETGGSLIIQADQGLAVVSADDVRTTEQESIEGEAKVTVGVGNAYNDAYLAVKAATQVGAAGAKAASTVATFGFYTDVRMEVDGMKSSHLSEQTTAVGSRLIAEGDMSLSSGTDLHIQGSKTMVSGVMDLVAVEDVLIESAQNTYREDSASEKTHMEIGMGTADPTSWNAYNQANSNASGTFQREKHEYGQRNTQQVSSLLDVEGDLRANTEGDITIIASNVQVEGSGAIHAGGDVNILSAQETKSRSESHEKLDIGGVTGGWDGSRLSAGVKGEYTKDTLTETTITQKKSELGFGGGLLLNTEGSALISASDIETGGSLIIQADQGLAVVSADDVQTTEQEQTKGEAKITYGIGNAYNDAYLAVKAAGEAAENVKHAKEALDAFDDEIAQMRNDVKQGLVTEEDVREREADRKYLVTNLAMATANAANAAIQVGAAGAKAAAAASTSFGTGFYADVKMEVDGAKSSSRSEQTTAVGSSLIAGGDMNLSSGADLHIQGSDAMASGVMDLVAAEDVLIESAQNTYREDSSSEQTHMEIGMGTAGPSSWNASYNQVNSNASGASQRNSLIQAGAINIASGDDTTVAGAQVQAVDLALDVGGDLTVASRQNKDRSSSHQIGASIGSGSIGASGGQGYGLRKWVDQQTELVGTESVAITTGGNTHLKGATIANRTIDGTDGGDLMLRTASLTVEEIKDIDKANQWSAGITTGGSTSLQMGLNGHKMAQVNYVTIGQGSVLIDGLEGTVEGLNRDITQTTKVLANRKTGGLDVSVSVDHRVFSEGGWKSIKTDFYDTYDHGKDIGSAVGDYFDSEKDVSLSHYSNVVGDGARKRSYLKSAVFYEEDTREGLNQADADAEEVQTAMQNVADGLTGQEGTKVVIYDGDPNAIGIDGNLPTDNTQFNKNLAKGGYSSASDGIGVNAYQTDMASTDDKLQVIGHESYRAIADKQGYGYNAQTERAVAYRYGESVRDTWNAYSAIGGYQTNQNAGSTSGADWLAQNRNSSVIASGNEWIGRQDSQEMKPDIVLPVNKRQSESTDLGYQNPYTKYDFNVYDYDTSQDFENDIKKKGYEDVEEFITFLDKNLSEDPLADKKLSVIPNMTFEARQKGKNNGSVQDEEGVWKEIYDTGSYTRYRFGVVEADNENAKGKGSFGTVDGKERTYIKIHTGGPACSTGCVTKTDIRYSEGNNDKLESVLIKNVPSLAKKDENTYIYIPQK